MGFNVNMISSKLKQTVNNIPYHVKTGSFPLSKIDTKLIEGIQKSIPLFDTTDNFVSMENIDFITKKFETLNLFRGCNVGCSHCLKDAKLKQKSNRTILYEDLIRFTEGFKNLSERLGFNVFSGNKYVSIVDDSNPIDFPIRGLDGNHDVVDAIKLIYESIKLPILFVTSGWNQKSLQAQNSAKKIAKQFKENPQSLKDIEVSINPFSSIMEKSRKALLTGDSEKANYLRDLYTDRIANTILTFWEFFKGDNGLAKIIYRHAGNYKGNELVGEKETKKLYLEIYEKLKLMLGERIVEAPILDPEMLTKFDKSHLIEPSGRARAYFPFDINMKVQEGLIQESLNWNQLTQDEKFNFLKDNSLKCIDINGSIYTSRPATKTFCVNSPIELTTPTKIKLNFIRNNLETENIFSDIELETD